MHAELRALRAPVAFDGTRFVPGGATVLVEAGTITGVEPFDHPLPAGCPVTTYDGTLLPGLIDAHVHLVATGEIGSLERAGSLPEEEVDALIVRSLAQQRSAGVTTVRDLGDTRYRSVAARDRRVPGAPRIVAAGPPVTVPEGHCHYLGGVVAGPGEIGPAVAEHVERGVDVVKVMASGGMVTLGTDVLGVQFAADDLRSLVDAVHEAGLRVLAHAHSLAGIRHALQAGVDGIEHFTGLTSNGVEVPDDVLEQVAAADVAVDPTLGFDRDRLVELPAPPPGVQEAMRRSGMDFEGAYTARLDVVRRMRAHGVRLVSGSDAGVGPLKQHGCVVLSVIDLTKAGFAPADALATATGAAAAACGLDGVTGELAPGRAADVLVVDGDLSTGLDALRRPVAVTCGGVDVVS